MACEILRTPDGKIVAIACSRNRQPRPKRCSYCGAETWILCDYPEGKGTCDKPICKEHAQHVGPDTDYCVAHGATKRILPAAEAQVEMFSNVSYLENDKPKEKQ